MSAVAIVCASRWCDELPYMESEAVTRRGASAALMADVDLDDTIDTNDPLWAALPAEKKKAVEDKWAEYADEDEKKRPALAFPLFPEVPLPGEQVVPPPLPKQPPRKPVGPHYCLGGQPEGWVAKSIAMSAPRPKLLSNGRPMPRPKPLPQDRPAWQGDRTGKWKETGGSLLRPPEWRHKTL